MPSKFKSDGLEVLREEISNSKIARLIEQTARWVDPATFKFLPVWFPEHARGKKFYKKGWSSPQTNTNKVSNEQVHKKELNTYGSKALRLALGIDNLGYKNWSCCHIWSADDPTFQTSNHIVQDHRFFSCVGNMVLLPTPLKAFTDAMPELKTMLRLCAKNTYGWSCGADLLPNEHAAMDNFTSWDDYPKSWPRTFGDRFPIGVMHLNPVIHQSAKKRLEKIWFDLVRAGEFYPREKVQDAMSYWENHLKEYAENIDRPPLTNDSSRFAATADDIVSVGKVVDVEDHLTDEQRASNARHDAIMAELRQTMTTGKC